MAAANGKAYATIGTTLEYSKDGTTWTKLTPIVTFPALGGDPEQIDVTDMSDEMQTFILGVQQMDGMEFTANYSPAKYKAIDDLSLQDLKYRLKLGKGGALGTAKWDGQHSVRITEGEVNGKIGMTIKCSNSTKVVVDVEPAA